ncbi:hypothetical protein I0C86_01635 [Plantactinospora sp. S1510]|uniref:Serine protease n=1 Tax=Plantactinospora alkalitolerans TaxID=2789879 RepID=A0ABS0GNZ6_9ACTN|nr:hypothetical protein [Plantactinospora alkalitolerans]MBF9127703.1 hypothetical protein [Plantactinospora alkalitolerans]
MSRVPIRRLLAAALALTVAAGLATGTPTRAAAGPATGTPTRAAAEDKPEWTSDDPKAGSNSAAEIMAAQAPLVAFASRITELDEKFAALGGLRLRVEKRTVDLWWKGEVPAEVREEIVRADAEGVRVELGEAEFSQRELVERTASLPESWREYPGLVEVGPAVDGSGLLLGVTRDADPSGWDFGVPAEVVRTEEFTAYSRRNDVAPWWGGAEISAPVSGAGGRCSTGFAVARHFLWWETSRGMLTAEHCAPGGGVPFVDPTGEQIGVAEPAPARRLSDSLYIPTRSGARIYDGGVGVGEFSKPVAGATANFPGQFVCTSGAGTGVHCDIRTDRINLLVFVSGGSFVSSAVLAHEVNGRAAAGTGDSGGPVFTLTQNFSKTLAAGLIVGGRTAVGCGSFGASCGNEVAFVDIGFVLLAQNASLLTS